MASESDIILEDKTKSGLEIKETSIDEEFDIMADKGMIHDMDGIGHWVIIRKFFPKNRFDLNHVLYHAKLMEEKYTKLRDLTCPD